MSKNVRSIVHDYLKANGHDGLYNDIFECGCELSDLMPCEFNTDRCQPAKKVPGCSDECGEECDWHMYPVEVDDE